LIGVQLPVCGFSVPLSTELDLEKCLQKVTRGLPVRMDQAVEEVLKRHPALWTDLASQSAAANIRTAFGQLWGSLANAMNMLR
jgi:hypothetical protein